MGFFKAITGHNFKKSESGDNLYYPWSSYGAGYIIESEEQAKKLKRNHFILWLIGLVTPFIILYCFDLGNNNVFRALGIWVFIYYLFYFVFVKSLTAKLACAKEKLTFLERLNNIARSFKWPLLIFGEICSIYTTIVCIYVFLVDRTDVHLGRWILYVESLDIHIGVAIVAFFGFVTVLNGYVIHLKLKLQREEQK